MYFPTYHMHGIDCGIVHGCHLTTVCVPSMLTHTSKGCHTPIEISLKHNTSSETDNHYIHIYYSLFLARMCIRACMCVSVSYFFHFPLTISDIAHVISCFFFKRVRADIHSIGHMVPKTYLNG